jgi:pyruvate-formate lyase-activating enzyme
VQTSVYNIAVAPSQGHAYLHFWGCNLSCSGCLCQKEIYDFMLAKNRLVHLEEPRGKALPPQRFLDSSEVMRRLGELKPKFVLFEGQEAALDPGYPVIAEACHREFGSRNVLLTNAYRMPPLEHTDHVAVSLKAFDPDLHKEYTGVSNKPILENLKRLSQKKVSLSVETVLIPEYVDPEEVERIAAFIASIDNNIRLQVDAYFKVAGAPWRRPSREEMDRAVALAKRHLKNVFCFYGGEELKYEVKSIFPNDTELELNDSLGFSHEKEKTPQLV